MNEEASGSARQPAEGEPGALERALHESEELRRSERMYRTAFDAMDDGIHVMDAELRITLLNRGFCRWMERLGYSADLLGKRLGEAFPFLPDQVGEEYRQVFSSGTTLHTEETTQVGDRSFVTETRKIPILENGRVVRVVTVVRDITESKRFEQALLASEDRFRTLAELLPEIVFETDVEGTLQFVNRRTYEMTGYAPEDFEAGINAAELVVSEDREAVQRSVASILSGGKAPPRGQEYTARRKDGSHFPILVYPTPILRKGRPIGLRGIIIDISERKRQEEELRRAYERLRELGAIIDRSPAVVFAWRNVEGLPVEFVSENVRQFGRSAEEFISGQASWVDMIHPEDRARALQEVQEFERRGIREYTQEYRVVLPSGEIRHVQDRSLALEDEQGKVIQHQGIILDITEHREAEQALSRSEQNFQALFESMVEGVAICDMIRDEQGRAVDYVVRSVNPAYCQLTGIQQQEALGARASELYGIDEAPFLGVVDRVARTREPARFEAYSDPVDRYFSISVFSPAPDRFAILMEDITDQRRHELERDRLIGELESRNVELNRYAHTVSHDLKTPLITINGFLALMEEAIQQGRIDSLQEPLQRVAHAADRMAELLDGLLELSRIGRTVSPPERLDLAELAREAVQLATGRLEQQGVEVTVSPDLPVVRGDRHRLLEVFQNLLENAVKFMGDQPEPRIQIGLRRDGETPVVTVRDNGMGVDPQYHRRIFQVFDQLDQKQEGTGMGLSLARRIIEVHGGQLWVESQGRGKGATFCFSLPDRAESPEASEPAG